MDAIEQASIQKRCGITFQRAPAHKTASADSFLLFFLFVFVFRSAAKGAGQTWGHLALGEVTSAKGAHRALQALPGVQNLTFRRPGLVLYRRFIKPLAPADIASNVGAAPGGQCGAKGR
jgi:hypothetical protein